MFFSSGQPPCLLICPSSDVNDHPVYRLYIVVIIVVLVRQRIQFVSIERDRWPFWTWLGGLTAGGGGRGGRFEMGSKGVWMAGHRARVVLNLSPRKPRRRGQSGCRWPTTTLVRNIIGVRFVIVTHTQNGINPDGPVYYQRLRVYNIHTYIYIHIYAYILWYSTYSSTMRTHTDAPSTYCNYSTHTGYGRDRFLTLFFSFYCYCFRNRIALSQHKKNGTYPKKNGQISRKKNNSTAYGQCTFCG